MISDHINQELLTLKEKKNYRSLPPLIHDGRNVILNGQRMVNLSSNDYLGLANNIQGCHLRNVSGIAIMTYPSYSD